MAGLTVRLARQEDLAALYAELARGDREQVDLGSAIVLVAEERGEIVGFAAARAIIQLEPLHIMDRVRGHRARRAGLMLARAMDGLLLCRWGCYYAYIRDAVMQKLARHFGYREVYAEGKWFLREAQ